REYGRDAVITAGKVTAGTALPPYTFQYSGEAPGVKTHADGQAFEVPNVGDGVIALSYGDIGTDRSMHSVYLYGSEQTTNTSNRYFCNLVRGDTGEVTSQEAVSNCNDNGNGQIRGVDFRFLRSAAAQKKQVLYRYYREYDSCGRNDCGSPEYRIETLGNWSGSLYGFPNIVADFDGDGLDDGLMLPGNEKPVNSGNASVPVPTVATQHYTFATQKSWSNLPNKADARDVDGDGLADLYFKDGDRLVVRRSNGRDSFVEVINKPVSTFNRVAAVGDFNGDGLGDFLVSVDGVSRFRVWFNLGRDLADGGEFDLPLAYPSVDPSDAANKGPFLVVDADADGRDDIVAQRKEDGTRFHVYLNRTQGTTASIGGAGANFEFGGTLAFVEDRDFNGVPEIAASNRSDFVYEAKRQAVISARPDLLTLV
ncbi:FG-GAP repeat domain-containing protein, partial [Pannonibacter tanglangensis]